MVPETTDRLKVLLRDVASSRPLIIAKPNGPQRQPSDKVVGNSKAAKLEMTTLLTVAVWALTFFLISPLDLTA